MPSSRAVRIGKPGPFLTLIDPATPVGVQPVGKSSGYSLAFSDEFAGTSLDTLKWATSYPDTPFWNATTPGGHLTNTGEPEAYDPSGITFPGGAAGSVMRLTMRQQVTVPGLPYTSGMVTSFPSFNTIYGYFEARMKLRDVQDAWPAFWLDPTNTSAWPPEIDIMENFATASYNSVVRNTVLWNGTGSPDFTEYSVPGSLEQWHTYGCEWRNGSITWFTDGVQTKTFSDSTGKVSTAQMYLICNLAAEPSNNVPAAALPFYIDVDYIRAWA